MYLKAFCSAGTGFVVFVAWVREHKLIFTPLLWCTRTREPTNARSKSGKLQRQQVTGMARFLRAAMLQPTATSRRRACCRP